MSLENRKFDRIPEEIPVTYKIITLSEVPEQIPPGTGVSESTNISEGGILISSKEDIPTQSKVEVSFTLDQDVLFMKGKVMRSTRLIRNGERIYDLGISFGPTFKEDLKTLQGWIAQKLKSSSPPE